MRGSRFAFYRPEEPVLFSAAEERRFVALLQATSRTTVLGPLESEADLQLGLDGRTVAHQYQLSRVAFLQICQRLAPQIGRVLLDLSGSRPRPKTARDDLIDGSWAREIYNQLVKLRFPDLQPYQLVRHTQRRWLDGLIGPKHCFLDNEDLYRRWREILPVEALDFHSAVVAGRRLGLWLRRASPAFTVQAGSPTGPDAYHVGAYLCNGEAAGTSVRATAALFTPRGTALLPFSRGGGHLHHAGKDFQLQLGKLLARVPEACQEFPVEACRQSLLWLAGEALPGADELMRWLRRRDVDAAVCLMACRLVDGGSGLGGLLAGRPRTLLDLWLLLGELAKHMPLSRRERLEQTLFTILETRNSL